MLQSKTRKLAVAATAAVLAIGLAVGSSATAFADEANVTVKGNSDVGVKSNSEVDVKVEGKPKADVDVGVKLLALNAD